ncbi:MAG TPA: hypothetical protein VHM20_06835, partial [Gammaproteobacteria bacterium]|nr:hypothetical protein [Gammaproteobacteria bacterium]
MKLVAELLADQCFITSMDLIDNHYLAVTYHTNKNLSHTLGIWDIHQVIAGQQNPFRTFPLNASDYNPKLLGLSNQKVAYANIPSATIDFYDFKEKLFSFTMKQWCGYHSLKFTNTANDCVIASINDATQNIEIHVIDLHTQKLKHNFLLNQTKRVDELKHFEITHNKYLFFTYLAS